MRRRRAAAAEVFAAAPLPTEKEEVWRYSRIDELDLDRFRPTAPDARPVDAGPTEVPTRLRPLLDAVGTRAGLVVTEDGGVVAVASDGTGATVGRAVDLPEGPERLGSVVGSDAHDFQILNDAFAAEPLVVDVAAGAVMVEPIVVLHLVGGSRGAATFPRTVVRAGTGSRAAVVELVVDAGAGLLGGVGLQPDVAAAASDRERLVVPVTELEVADEAELSYVGIQALAHDTWHLGHQVSTIGRDARLRSFALAVGGGYARLRTDSSLTGEAGTSELRAAYVGRDEQMLDFRTLQDHAAPRTVSDLLFMGAVADRSHSVYSGLIRIRRGAVRADARQTNHNLVLDEGAHADSVPNLDIEENDVRCSHGSTVGPVDEDQRYYLESRGVEPSRAEQLIVAGFFREIAGQVPVPGVRPFVDRVLAERSGVVGG
ncbi:MAG: Fe-S cluster assembly protein SufD [Acidimicrobiales bacterium]|nr:Fe-S cluster assembly protein SufD [Acidimicrobiales bacterium]